MIELLPYGAVLSSADAPAPKPEKHFWVDGVKHSEGQVGWCPGEDLNPGLFGEICKADLTHNQDVINAVEAGVSPLALNIANDFRPGLMTAGQR